jgi:hypothetical protein
MGWKASLAAPAISLAALCAAGGALAETLHLECRVRETRDMGGHRELLRRLEINLDVKTVKFYDNVGHGWEFKNEYSFPAFNHERITLEANPEKESWVDRATGEYFFHNRHDGVTMRGPCEKAQAPRPRF